MFFSVQVFVVVVWDGMSPSNEVRYIRWGCYWVLVIVGVLFLVVVVFSPAEKPLKANRFKEISAIGPGSATEQSQFLAHLSQFQKITDKPSA